MTATSTVPIHTKYQMLGCANTEPASRHQTAQNQWAMPAATRSVTGVATATSSALRRYGCAITQGFVHSPPLPPDDLRDWITRHAPNSKPSQSEQAGVTD